MGYFLLFVHGYFLLLFVHGYFLLLFVHGVFSVVVCPWGVFCCCYMYDYCVALSKTISADGILKYLSYFSEKIGFEISYNIVRFVVC